jgi:hypothetical protein
MDHQKKDSLSSLPIHTSYWIGIWQGSRQPERKIELRLKSLRAEMMAIETKIISAPANFGLLKELCKVDN